MTLNRPEFNPDATDDRFYSTAEVAKVFGVKPETVRDWIKSGKLKAEQIGGMPRWRVRRSVLQAFAQSRYEGPAIQPPPGPKEGTPAPITPHTAS